MDDVSIFMLIMTLAFCFYTAVMFSLRDQEINDHKQHNKKLISANELLRAENLKLKSELKKWKHCRAENGRFFKCEDE